MADKIQNFVHVATYRASDAGVNNIFAFAIIVTEAVKKLSQEKQWTILNVEINGDEVVLLLGGKEPFGYSGSEVANALDNAVLNKYPQWSTREVHILDQEAPN